MSDVIEQLEGDWDGFVESLLARGTPLTQGSVVRELAQQASNGRGRALGVDILIYVHIDERCHLFSAQTLAGALELRDVWSTRGAKVKIREWNGSAYADVCL